MSARANEAALALAMLIAAPAAADPPVDHQALEPQAVTPDDILPGRRRPGVPQPALPDAPPILIDPSAIRPPPPEAFPQDEIPVPDRWRLMDALCLDRSFTAAQAVCRSPLDPYHQSWLKGDRPIDRARVPWLPIKGSDWFVILGAISDTVVEPRAFPTPVGVQTGDRPGSLDTFGRSSSLAVSQTITTSLSLLKGSTAFAPAKIEYHLTLAYDWKYTTASEHRILSIRPSDPLHRTDAFLGVQEAYIGYAIRTVSDHYDFDGIRVGIQNFQADFRGFLLDDSLIGVRLFGNRDNNRFQYNLGLFRRLEKDTNSGLNDLGQSPRKDYILLANLYRQDLPVPGFTSQILAAWNHNREGGEIYVDHNGFPVRPALLGDVRGHDYDAVYLGYNGDGHFGRVNLTVSTYAVLGHDSHNVLTGSPARIRALFAAAEPSYDFGWVRLRGALLYASGDGNPRDGTETGYDAILENPLFAGADTSYWIRQSIPFAGGGRAIAISGTNGILNDLRSSKDDGQSNFLNPGTVLAGAGADFDVLPSLRISANINHLWFDTTRVLQVLRNEGSIPRAIGWDYSVSTIWRPFVTQNIVFRVSGAVLDAGAGFRDLFTQSNGSGRYYSLLFNTVLRF